MAARDLCEPRRWSAAYTKRRGADMQFNCFSKIC